MQDVDEDDDFMDSTFSTEWDIHLLELGKRWAAKEASLRSEVKKTTAAADGAEPSTVLSCRTELLCRMKKQFRRSHKHAFLEKICF